LAQVAIFSGVMSLSYCTNNADSQQWRGGCPVVRHGAQGYVKLPKSDLCACRVGRYRIDYVVTVWRGGRVAEGNGLLNRRRGINPYRGFESRPLRYVRETCYKSLNLRDL
jgi:hypothetical protein